MTNIVFSLANEFSKYPGGRFRKFGPHSGEEFRDDVLIPLLNSNQRITIDLDGVRGTPSSFFEEAFGGLVRVRGFEKTDLLRRLAFTSSEDGSQIEEILAYINNAKSEK